MRLASAARLLALHRHAKTPAARPSTRTAHRSSRAMADNGAAAAAAATGPVCVHAATAAELSAARQALEQAQPLVSRRAAGDQPEQHCRLVFPSQPGQADGGNGGGGTGGNSSSSSAHVCSSGDGACGAFSVPRFLAALQTQCLGRLLLTAAATTSTQIVVQENVAKLLDGLVFVADKQYGGKGRGGNVWESPDGCLMFSALQRLDIPGQRLPFVQYIVSLAVVQAVQAEAAARLQAAGLPAPASSLGVRIKWPNDIYAGSLKLGGILCHSSYRDKRFHVIMGVGLNLANRSPTTCVDALIEQAAAAEQQGQQQAGQQGQQQSHRQLEPVRREDLLAGILSRLEPMLQRMAAEGFGPFEEEYCRHWLHSDQQVQLEEGGQLIPVTIKGLSSSGYLLAVDAAGERFELHPDGNSLDFFKGLVRKKAPA